MSGQADSHRRASRRRRRPQSQPAAEHWLNAVAQPVRRRRLLSPQTLAALLALLCFGWTSTAAAERKIEFDGFDVHYIVIPTVFLSREIASQYDLVRGKAWSLVNISVIDELGNPRKATVSGSYRNLIDQTYDLDFREVVEDNAVYYLAPVKHTDEDIFRYTLEVKVPGEDEPLEVTFTQKMYRGLE